MSYLILKMNLASSIDRNAKRSGKRVSKLAIIITSYTHAAQPNVQNASKCNIIK